MSMIIGVWLAEEHFHTLIALFVSSRKGEYERLEHVGLGFDTCATDEVVLVVPAQTGPWFEACRRD